VAGGLFLTEAERKVLRGLVVTVQDNGIHCYSTSINPYSGTLSHLGKLQVPIGCGGVEICPGDIVIGDADGVIVPDVEALENIIETAENIVAKEKMEMVYIH